MGTNTNTHVADGLYYLDLDLLEARGACFTQRARWRQFFGAERVPITLEVVLKMHTLDDRCVFWAANTMLSRYLATTCEFNGFKGGYYATYSARVECIAFMDLLAARARREGRLS